MQHSFPRRGLTINVDAGESVTDKIKVWFVEDGITKEYIRKGIPIDDDSNTVVLLWHQRWTGSRGNTIPVPPVISFAATDQTTVERQVMAEYFYELPATRLGNDLAKRSINGLLTFLFGEPAEITGQVSVFAGDGEFYTPITADAVVVGTSGLTGSITINVVDGVAGPEGFRYQLLNIPNSVPQSSNEFTGLPAGLYLAYVGSSASTPYYFYVTVEEVPEV